MIFVDQSVGAAIAMFKQGTQKERWNEVEDMTEALRKMQQEGSHTEESDEEEES